MKNYKNAWSGMHIAVYHEGVMGSMIVESLISANPYLETDIDQFESYESCYDFTKKNKQTGLIFIDANIENLEKITENLAGNYSGEFGLSCLFVYVTEVVSIQMAKLINSNTSILDVATPSDLTDSDFSKGFLSDLWNKYLRRSEEALIPSSQADMLRDLAFKDTYDQTSYSSYLRIMNLITENANISYLDVIALKWKPIIEATRDHFSRTQNSVSLLANICDSVKELAVDKSPAAFVDDKNEPLVERIGCALKALTGSNSTDFLNELGSRKRIKSSALLKNIVSKKEEILTVREELKKAS